MSQRQEVLNVLLAQLLQERGVVAAPEQILKAHLQSVKLPDVLVDFQGLRLIIEAEFAVQAGAAAERAAYAKASERVEQAIAHIGVAVVYPSKLKKAAFQNLSNELENSRLKFAIINEAVLVPSEQLGLFKDGQSPQFSSGNVDDLVDALRRCYEQLVIDTTLEKAVGLLQADIDKFSLALYGKKGSIGRMADALNVGQPQDRSNKEAEIRRQQSALVRVTALIIANAMIFQQVLSSKDRRVRPLDEISKEEDILPELLKVWHFILTEINYYPIFYMADRLLSCQVSDIDLDKALCQLMQTAMKIVKWRASLRHDLAGRIYHRLLEEAKYLGAFYTSIPAAALLLKLALNPRNYNLDWSSLSDLADFRVADLACGTGTLLMASADVIVDNYVRACVENTIQPDLDKVQHVLVEDIIYGYDVLPSAVHLTASTLSLRVPETPINVSHLYTLPLGNGTDSLGSLEFIRKDSTAGTLFGKSEQITGKGRVQKETVTIPQLDLCVMNPPFTRSVGGNLLFGNLPQSERDRLQTILKKIVSAEQLSASITAGLGSVFAALGDKYIKPDGRIALVLPRALVSGVSWKPTRDLLSQTYQLEYLIVSHEANHWNFSENTELSEVLIIARKLKDQASEDARVICLNIWKQPSTAIEALNIASSLSEQTIPDLAEGRGSAEIAIGDTKLAEAASIKWKELRDGSWNFPCSFAQTELNRSLLHLRKGKLYLPGTKAKYSIPLCPLQSLASLGYDRRDMHDGFKVSKGATAFPAFWSHKTDSVTTIEQIPNLWLNPLVEAKEGRPLRDAEHLWKKAGKVLIAERLWLFKTRLTAIKVQEKVLSNVWWPIIFNRQRNIKIDDIEKIIVLWMNSTLGILLLLTEREETRGAWVDFKKPVLHALPVLDVPILPAQKRKKLVEAYNHLALECLLPLPGIEDDTTRKRIDQAFSEALNLPDIDILRNLLAREPIICLTTERLLHG